MMKRMAVVMLGVVVSMGAGAAEDEPLNLKCRIDSCQPQENCQQPYNLAGNPFRLAAGSEFIFALTGDWDVSPAAFHLDRKRYVGDSYMSRTVLDIVIARPDGGMRIGISTNNASGTRQAQAEGRCDMIRAVPVTF